MAPLERITADSVGRFLEVVSGLPYLGASFTYFYLGTDGHPDPMLFGMNRYLLLGVIWFVAGVLTWGGIRYTRHQLAAGDE